MIRWLNLEFLLFLYGFMNNESNKNIPCSFSYELLESSNCIVFYFRLQFWLQRSSEYWCVQRLVEIPSYVAHSISSWIIVLYLTIKLRTDFSYVGIFRCCTNISCGKTVFNLWPHSIESVVVAERKPGTRNRSQLRIVLFWLKPILSFFLIPLLLLLLLLLPLLLKMLLLAFITARVHFDPYWTSRSSNR